MPPLPDDVIFAHIDIGTFLKLRLLNRHLHNLINYHAHGLTESVARSTFPGQTRILMHLPHKEAADHSECLRWLKDLRCQQLAAILLERGPCWWVAADNPIGDDMRRAFAKGRQVLADCSRIARKVAAIPPQQIPQRHLTQASAKSETEAARAMAMSRDLETCWRCMKYLETLDLEYLQGHEYLQRQLTQHVFGFPYWDVRFAHPGQQDRADNEACELWVLSYTLKLGPEPFWRAWWASDPCPGHEGQFITTEVEAAWDERDEHTLEYERQKVSVFDHQVRRLERRVRSQLQSKSHGQIRSPEAVKRLLDFPHLWEIQSLREMMTQGEPPPPRASEGVHFEQNLEARMIGRTTITKWPVPPGQRRRRRTACGGGNSVRRLKGCYQSTRSCTKNGSAVGELGKGWARSMRRSRNAGQILPAPDAAA